MCKSVALKRKVKINIYFLLNELDYFSNDILFENCIEDDLNDYCDMAYSIKKFNEISQFEI